MGNYFDLEKVELNRDLEWECPFCWTTNTEEDVSKTTVTCSKCGKEYRVD